MQFYPPPPPPFPHTYTHHFFIRSSNFFVYLYTYEGFLLLLTSRFQLKKRSKIYLCPPPPLPLFVDFSSSLYVCLSVSLCLSLSRSLARSFSHFTNLTIQSIIPKNQTHKHTCSFHTFQKLKLDLIVVPWLHR